MISKYTVIIDTRERKPLDFSSAERCQATIFRKIDTGDYTLEGYEDLLCIERKGSVNEITTNIIEKRFYAELERMRTFKYKFIVCEFPLYDVLNFPLGDPISQKVKFSTKLTPQFILKALVEIEMKYDVHIIYTGNRTNSVAYINSIFKRVLDLDGKKGGV